MSINLTLEAELEAETKLGKKIIREEFELWQTPSKVTEEALKSNDVYSFYRDWILKINPDVQLPIYADDDFFCKGEPIAYETANIGVDHIKELEEWIEEHKDWNLIWSEI